MAALHAHIVRSLVILSQFISIFDGNRSSMVRENVSALLPTLCMCMFANGCFIYSTPYYSNVCCACANMGDKRDATRLCYWTANCAELSTVLLSAVLPLKWLHGEHIDNMLYTCPLGLQY